MTFFCKNHERHASRDCSGSRARSDSLVQAQTYPHFAFAQIKRPSILKASFLKKLWKWTVSHTFLFNWITQFLMNLLTLFWCVPTHHIQNHWNIYTVRNRFFIRFPVTFWKGKKPLKVPKIKDFHESVRCSRHMLSTCAVYRIPVIYCIILSHMIACSQAWKRYKNTFKHLLIYIEFYWNLYKGGKWVALPPICKNW